MQQVIDGDYVITTFPNGSTAKELRFVPEPIVAPWTKKDFLLRFTPAEYGAIKAATLVNHELDYYWTLFNVAGEILKTDPVTVAGIHALESAGLIAAGRAAQILS